MAINKVDIYDTTLRDGSQMEGISFSVEDKLRITEKLDDLGISYIEGGWPGSNPKDIEYFRRAKNLKLKNAKLVAFGSTKRANIDVEDDLNIKALLAADIDHICIFGKSWDLHVKDALNVPLEENLRMIEDSVKYLKGKGKTVFFDAEHFFDAYKRNQEYAMETIKTAEKFGADVIILCDTNGGTLPFEAMEIVKAVKNEIKTPLGIHAHNDSETAVANSIISTRMGVTQVHGTINGFGERCGNANLCSIIPALQLKIGLECITDKQLAKLTEVSRYVNEIANLTPQNNMPYAGTSAFAHKGGIHINAVLKSSQTYEHIKPELVGNSQRFLISELSGKSNILAKAKEYGIEIKNDDRTTKRILDKIKNLENEGYQFEGAEASFELLMKKAFHKVPAYFRLEGYRTISDNHGDEIKSEATVKIIVDGKMEHTAAEGNGPVNALDNALRKALEKFYPQLSDMHLIDYKVRVLDTEEGTGAKVRVLIHSSDGKSTWGTVGVDENIIDASLLALSDSIAYKLMKSNK